MGHLRALFNVAGHSLRFRLGGVLLTVVSVALSVFVLLAGCTGSTSPSSGPHRGC